MLGVAELYVRSYGQHRILLPIHLPIHSTCARSSAILLYIAIWMAPPI
jgi:hypothetical protein